MCILGKDKLVELIEKSRCVYPFDMSLLDGDGYVLTVRDETTLNCLEHKNLISKEVVFTPLSSFFTILQLENNIR